MKQSLISFAFFLFLFLNHSSAASTQSPALAPSQDKPALAPSKHKPVETPAQAPTKPAVQVQPPSQASPAQSPAEVPLVQAPSEVPLVQAPPGKAKPAPTNVTKILEKAGNFGVFIRILRNTQVINQIENQLNTSNSLTILAPTNGAFSGLKAGTLNSLTTEQKVQLVQYHILPSFISLSNFQTLSNPVRTQASNSEEYPLNITTEGNWVNISTGLVNTSISGTVYADNQLAIYKVDRVLLPLGIFAPRPKALAPAPALAKPDKDSSTSSSSSSSLTGDDSPAAVLNQASYGFRVARNGVVTVGVLVASLFVWGQLI